MSGIAPPPGADADTVLGFTLPDRDARGRMVRLGPVLDEILSAHSYPPVIRDLLAEALVLTVLMGSLLQDDGQLTIQAQAEGAIVDLLACDWRAGELRGYVRHDGTRLAELPESPALDDLFGGGYLAITFDLATTDQRYQGIVPLEGASLAAACEAYFAQSEQVPTLIRLGIRHLPGGIVAGGLLVQHLPEGEDGRERLHVRMDHPEWEHVAALAVTTGWDELTDGQLPLRDLLWRLFHEEREVRVSEIAEVIRGCRCSIAHFRQVLSRFGAAELDEMRDERGVIAVDCAFCSRVFDIDV